MTTLSMPRSGRPALPVEPLLPLPTSADDSRLDGWYHTIELAPGLVSRGLFDHRVDAEAVGLPASLEGKTVLDVATADGFWAFEMERRGAERVVALDIPCLGESDWLPSFKATASADSMQSNNWQRRFATAHAMRKSRVEYHFCNVYDLTPERFGVFDFVFCGNLLLHLKNPLQALINVRAVTGESALVNTGAIELDVEQQYPDRSYLFFGHLHAEDKPGRNNVYWGFSTKALHDMLIYAGFSRAETYPRHHMRVDNSVHRSIDPAGLDVVSARGFV